LAIEFIAPALMDDLLDVETGAGGVRGATLTFEQRITRDGQELATAKVVVVAIRGERATRLPDALRHAVGRVGDRP
jgi:acyl-CoA thioester hydrolase